MRDVLSGAAALLLGLIGGQPSSEPAVVCITADTLPVCSGALVGAHTVLTAGHCADVLGAGTAYFVAFGPDCRAPSRRVRIAEFVTHPGYTREGEPHDLALARMEPAADAGVFGLTADAGATITRIGYGISDEGNMSGWGTQRALTQALTREDEDFLYAGDAGATSCSGDSGGPTLAGRAIAAVMSDGADCHSEGWDAKVDLAWIQTTLAEWDPPAAQEPPKTGCSCSEVPFSLAPLLLMALRALAKTARQ